MVVGRTFPLLAAATLVAFAGCTAGRQGTLAKQESPVVQSNATVASFVEKYNKNAAGVRALSAQPGIEVAGGGRSGNVDGRLDFERDKNFRLVMNAGPMGSKVADIGSNDQGFWFWSKGDEKNKLLVCDYQHLNDTQLSVTLQPDWIIESLGMREITDREAATINLSRSPDRPGTIVLTQFRKDAKGESLTKETIVDEASGHIVEHRLWAGAKKTLLAKATISRYQQIKIAATETSPSDTVVEIPARFKLEWFLEQKFSLDVTMGTAVINPDFPQERRMALFAEPKIRGAERFDIAQQASPPSKPSARIHETMPQPRAGGIKLGQPESLPVDVQGAYGKPSTEPYRLPTLPADTTSITSESPVSVVTAPVPRGSDIAPVQTAANNRWGRSNGVQ